MDNLLELLMAMFGLFSAGSAVEGTFQQDDDDEEDDPWDENQETQGNGSDPDGFADSDSEDDATAGWYSDGFPDEDEGYDLDDADQGADGGGTGGSWDPAPTTESAEPGDDADSDPDDTVEDDARWETDLFPEGDEDVEAGDDVLHESGNGEINPGGEAPPSGGFIQQDDAPDQGENSERGPEGGETDAPSDLSLDTSGTDPGDEAETESGGEAANDGPPLSDGFTVQDDAPDPVSDADHGTEGGEADAPLESGLDAYGVDPGDNVETESGGETADEGPPLSDDLTVQDDTPDQKDDADHGVQDGETDALSEPGLDPQWIDLGDNVETESGGKTEDDGQPPSDDLTVQDDTPDQAEDTDHGAQDGETDALSEPGLDAHGVDPGDEAETESGGETADDGQPPSDGLAVQDDAPEPVGDADHGTEDGEADDTMDTTARPPTDPTGTSGVLPDDETPVDDILTGKPPLIGDGDDGSDNEAGADAAVDPAAPLSEARDQSVGHDRGNEEPHSGEKADRAEPASKAESANAHEAPGQGEKAGQAAPASKAESDNAADNPGEGNQSSKETAADNANSTGGNASAEVSGKAGKK